VARTILRDDAATESDFLLASELAGDLTVIDDVLAEALLAILRRGDRSENVRGGAAISLGPVLELADTEGFEDSDDPPITEHMFERINQAISTDILGVRARVLAIQGQGATDGQRL
jgi:hypothetical protein